MFAMQRPFPFFTDDELRMFQRNYASQIRRINEKSLFKKSATAYQHHQTFAISNRPQ